MFSVVRRLFCASWGEYFVFSVLLWYLYTWSPHRFAANYSYVSEISNHLVPTISKQRTFNQSQPFCEIEPIIQSNVFVNTKISNEILQDPLEIEDGGEFAPRHCRPRYSVAIIVPYRNRKTHLDIFLTVFHNYLRRQLLHYRIFIVEQQDANEFNRGKLFNIGARYAADFGFPCFILHDVDLIPLTLGNIFACTPEPRHLSASLDSFRFNLPYYTLFGGAVAILANTFQKINGFSNQFEGWGGEDDDFYNRILAKNLTICRFAPEYSRYTMQKHEKATPNQRRHAILYSGYLRFDSDGVNSLRFEQKALISRPLFTHILAET